MVGQNTIGRKRTMNELIEILLDVRDDIDFERCTDLIDGKVLSSFDIIQIISALDAERMLLILTEAIRTAWQI